MKKQILNQILQDSVGRYPDRVAVQDEFKMLTYAELWHKSGIFAAQMLALGFRPGDTAIIFLEKSVESIVSFFGVLKAGGVYIPVDPFYSPPSRIFNIINSSESRFIITDSGNWALFRNYISETSDTGYLDGAVVMLTDSMFQANKYNMYKVEETDNLDIRYCSYDGFFPDSVPSVVEPSESDLAYILYTSGSTGVPKGVMILHSNALAFINWSVSYFKPVCDDVFSCHAPLHFDLSVFDIFVSLAAGATVKLVPFQITKNPRALLDWIAINRITTWYSVPSVWVSIMNYGTIKPEKFARLKSIIFAGEVFPAKHLKKLMQTLPESRYYNLYGPTETNVCAYYEVVSPDAFGNQPPPIGKACEGAELIALDEQGCPVPVGAAGELFVKGGTVTPGYYKAPEKSNRIFIESPLPRHDGALLYRTGDVVERIDKENYLYRGRKDLMVKCAGFRIELQEVETALVQYNRIEEAVAVPVINADGGVRSLAAYVTVKNNTDCSVLSLKRFLTEKIPKYMIPETIEIIKEMPRNANGKIDRQKVARCAG